MNKLSKLLPIFYLSEKLKKSFKDEIELRDGLKIIINEYKPKKNINISFDIQNAPVEIAFCLNGRMSVEFETNSIDNPKYKDTLEVSKGSAAFFYLPNTNGKLNINAHEKLTIVSLHCSPKFISQFFDNNTMSLASGKINITNNMIERSFVELTNSTSIMTNLVTQIYNCNFTGASKKMFLEAKGIELITLLLEHLKSQFIDEDSFVLSHDELNKIKTIEIILIYNLVEVPTLLELANIAGMTHTKLNKGFRKVFGNTVFNHLRELRIKKAKELLEEGKFNITEIAYETGWSSPSHLTKEFINKFGITPKQYLKNHKNQTK